MTGRSTPAAFLGAWRIETMELWAEDATELLGPGRLSFEGEAFGEFRFIAVRGWMDCRFAERDGKPLVEFSWEGKDERSLPFLPGLPELRIKPVAFADAEAYEVTRRRPAGS